MSKEILQQISAKVAFSLTCNLRCVYCRGADGRRTQPASMEDFRRKPMETGSISTEVLLEMLQALFDEGLRQIRPTGGEPLLRRDWDTVVNEAARIGYSNVDITTNGVLLESYLERKGSLPVGLSMVKVSLDTHDSAKFKEITRGGDLHRVVEGIKAISGEVYTRANRVLLRSEMNEKELSEFITFCQQIGLHGVQYLDLVHYNNLPGTDPHFFEREFVSFNEFRKIAEKVLGVKFVTTSSQYGVLFHQAVLLNGFKVSFKDSTVTMRDEKCKTCPVYCQEGRCLIRIATDGNLTLCPDYRGELPSFNVPETIADGSLHEKMSSIADVYISAEQVPTIQEFAQRHGLVLPSEL